MAVTRAIVTFFLLLSSYSNLWSTDGQIVFELSLLLDNSSACINTSLTSSPEARTEILNFVQSYNLTINITNPNIASCSNGIVNASFTSFSQLLTLCQLSELLLNSSFTEEDFLVYTVNSTEGRPVNRSCMQGPDNFQMTIIIVLASSGGSALLIICCLGVCMVSCQCVFESKRKKHSKVKRSSLSAHEEIVQLNQYEPKETGQASKTSAHDLDKADLDNYEALPATDFTTKFTSTCSVEVVPPPPPPPPIASNQNIPQPPPPPSLIPAEKGNSFAAPPPPPPPPILGSSRNTKEPTKPKPPPAAATAYIPPPPSLPKVSSTHTQQQGQIIEEVYDSTAIVFSSHSTLPPFVQEAKQEAEIEEIYDTGIGGGGEQLAGQLPTNLDMLEKFYQDAKLMEDDLGEDYETIDHVMQRDEQDIDDEECGDYTEMDFDHDYVNQNPLAKIPENNDLYY